MKKIYFLLLLVAVAGTSCKKWKCIKGDGVIVDELRNVSGFYGIINRTDANVFVEQDSNFQVIITGDENVIPYISIWVDTYSGNLYIEKNTKKCIRTDQPIEVDVRMPALEYIETSGSSFLECKHGFNNERIRIILDGTGDIDLYNLNTVNIIADLDGNGSINLFGINREGDFSLDGTGQIRANELVQDDCFVNIDGDGDVLVQVIKHLDVEISGRGNVVYYKIRPLNIDSRITGAGKVMGGDVK